MLFESRFEAQTDGIVCGPALLFVPDRPHPVGYVAPDWSKHFVISICAREGGELIWKRPFFSQLEALEVYARLINRPDLCWPLPGVWVDGELVYRLATVESFNSTPGGGTWTVPAGVTATDYLVVAGGGGGGSGDGGGGGAGGMRASTAFSVTPGATPTLTVGAGGVGAQGESQTVVSANGSNSVFDSITSTGGGRGGQEGNSNGGNGGSGGGGGAGNSTGTAGTGTVGQGNNGGTKSGFALGGGGGASAVGGNGGGTGGAGGAGSSSSITGSAVDYAGGGGGAARSGAGGTGGAGGGGNGGLSTNGSGTAGTANRGGGGGGGSDQNGHGGLGGYGFVALSYTPALVGKLIFGRGLRFYPRRR